MDINLFNSILLILLGVAAGIINTLAGGGSNLTIPALMILGMPADVANATNRIGVFLQAAVGCYGFSQQKILPTKDLPHLLKPLAIGAILGATCASYAPEALLKWLLLIAMISVSLVILLRSDTVFPSSSDHFYPIKDRPQAFWLLLLAGFYGGFVQAGVGFILIMALSGLLRYDLKSSNAIKVTTTLFFTGIALVIFIYNDQVLWLPGMILSIGTMIGAHIGVKMAIKLKPKTLKWFLFVMTLAASTAAIL